MMVMTFDYVYCRLVITSMQDDQNIDILDHRWRSKVQMIWSYMANDQGSHEFFLKKNLPNILFLLSLTFKLKI